MSIVLQSCLLMGLAALIASAPARTFISQAARNSPTFDTVTTVDCTNKEAVKFVSKTHGNFRCVYPENRRSSVVSNEDYNPILFNNFPVGLQSASLKLDSGIGCPDGTLFVPEIGDCVDLPKPFNRAPLESDSLVINEPKIDIPSTRKPEVVTVLTGFKKCKQDGSEVWLSELDICVKNPNPVTPQLPALNQIRADDAEETIAFAPVHKTEGQCPLGEFFLAELGICSPYKNSSPLESASLIRSPFDDSSLLSDGQCGDDEVFVAELGICEYAHKPAVQKPLVSDSHVLDVAPHIPFHQTFFCDLGFTYVPELDSCLPNPESSNNNNQAPPPSSNLIHEPDTLEITAFGTSKDRSDCPPGYFFVSEIGECL